MSGTDAIKGFSYQNSYTLYRLMDLLDEERQVDSVAVEGKGTDVEDLTITFADGTEEAIQVKKRETREGQYGLWGLSDINHIITALYQLFQSDRKVEIFRFVATGSAHPRVIAIQKACQRLRDDTYSSENDFKAVSDLQEMTGGSEKKTLDFMEKLWLDIPLESEAYFQQEVQNRLIKEFEVSAEDSEKVYNDLYKRVLDIGQEAAPESRRIDRQFLTDWLKNLPKDELSESTYVKIQQQVDKLFGKQTGVEIDDIEGDATIDVKQDVGEVHGELTGARIGTINKFSDLTDRKLDQMDEESSENDTEIDEK